MIFPEFLQQGDLITIVSPSGAIDGEVLEQAAAAIRRLGYSVKIAEHAKGKHHRFSATDECDPMRTWRIWLDAYCRPFGFL